MTMNTYHKLAWIAPGLLSIKNIEKNRHSQLILWHKFCKQDIIRRMNMKTLQWRGQTQILKGISFVWYWIGDVIFKVLVRLLVRIRVDGGDNVVGCITEFPDVTSPDTAPSLLRAACSWEFQHDDTFTFHLPPSNIMILQAQCPWTLVHVDQIKSLRNIYRLSGFSELKKYIFWPVSSCQNSWKKCLFEESGQNDWGKKEM